MAIESYDTMEDSVRYYGNSTHSGAHFPINIWLGFLAHRPAKHYVYVLTRWLLELPPGAWSSWAVRRYYDSYYKLIIITYIYNDAHISSATYFS